MFRVGNLLVDPDVIVVFPETLARTENILPVEFRGLQLRVVVGERPDPELLAAVNRTARYTQLGLRVMRAEADLVKRMVDELYSFANVEVSNCPVEFMVRCPRRWLEMRPTDQADIRRCSGCEQPIYLCRDEPTALEHVRQGHCIAQLRKPVDEE